MSHDCTSEYVATCDRCVNHDTTCGIRCGTCDERMCVFFGPEPAVLACGAHDNECQSCNNDHGCPECRVERMKNHADTAWNTPPTKSPSDFHDADWLHELRAEQRDYEYAQLIAREEERRAG